MHKISGNLTFQSLYSYWVGQVSIVMWIKHVKTYFCTKCFAWKIMETSPTLCVKLTKSIQNFSNDKEKCLIRIFHIISISCAKWPSGYSFTESVYRSTEWSGFESWYCFFHFSFFVRIKNALFIDLKINIFVVILK